MKKTAPQQKPVTSLRRNQLTSPILRTPTSLLDSSAQKNQIRPIVPLKIIHCKNPQEDKTKNPATQPTISFSQSLLQSQKRLFSMEQFISKVESADCLKLLSQLESIQSQKDLIALSQSLKTNDLKLLFPTLAYINSKKQRQQLMKLITDRSCMTLYIQGWLYLQQVWPHPDLQVALSQIIRQLNFKKSLKSEAFADKTKVATSPRLSQEWHLLPLIDEIAKPTYPFFIRKIKQEIIHNSDSLDDFFQRYAILPDSALAKEIIDSLKVDSL